MDTGVAVAEGDLLWTPSPERIAATNIQAYMDWLARERGLKFADYAALWRWSVSDIEAFWQSIWDYFKVHASAPPTAVLGARGMPGAEWFPGARLNYAEHILSRLGAGRPGLFFASETEPLASLDGGDLAARVRCLATTLRALGVKPGDRVVAYLPAIPQAVVALLASASIGAIWAVCSPDFGARGTLDRLVQLEPSVLIAVDGYSYGGKWFDRSAEVQALCCGLSPQLKLIHVPGRAGSAPPAGALVWDEIMAGPPVAADRFSFEQLPFGHPLWVLFSSGTTGLPKAIVHGHGGMLLEMLKLTHFHMDLHPGDRAFSFTTSGWMIWNFMVSSMLAGAAPIFYNGNPSFPGPGRLWQIAEEARVSFMGVSPAFIDGMSKMGMVPGNDYDLTSLRTVMPAGSPVSPACAAWFYKNIKKDLWVAPGSGGTDCCTGFVGGTPILPVYAGEMQAPHLGVAVAAFNTGGKPVIDEVGELVITQPMPSMPLFFWNDPEGKRYRETYFDVFPGVWCHGDFFRMNKRGGCFVLGRSDATLNRGGVRIGTAEIYRSLATIPEILDSLIMNLDLPGGKFFMPLFLKLRPGVHLDAVLEKKIKDHLRAEYTARHVPDRIIVAPDIPVTITGKKLEIPVRRILMGADPEKAASRDAMSNPAALDFYIDYAKTQTDFKRA
jgi:acetoacetyl-CoA synthetase